MTDPLSASEGRLRVNSYHSPFRLIQNIAANGGGRPLTRATRSTRLDGRPGAELLRVAHRPDAADVLAGDVEREHRPGDPVDLHHEPGLAVDGALQDRHAVRRLGGEAGQVAGDRLGA